MGPSSRRESKKIQGVRNWKREAMDREGWAGYKQEGKQRYQVLLQRTGKDRKIQ
jgi:hypothetical protein